MATIFENLTEVESIRQNIRQSIIDKGIEVPAGTAFAAYPAKIDEITGGGSGGSEHQVWQRPSDWLSLPVPEDNEVYALVAVYPNGTSTNTANIGVLAYNGTPSVPTTPAELQVDYGDGTVLSYTPTAPTSIPLHIYDYENPLLIGTETDGGYRQAIIKISITSSPSFFYIVSTYNSDEAALASSMFPSNVLEISVGNSEVLQQGLRLAPMLKNINVYKSASAIIGDPVENLQVFGPVTSLQVSKLVGEKLVLPINVSEIIVDNFYARSIVFPVTNSVLQLEGCPLLENITTSCAALTVTGLNTLKTVDLRGILPATNSSFSFSNLPCLRKVFFPAEISADNTAFLSQLFSTCLLLESCELTISSGSFQASSMFSSCRTLRSVKLQGNFTIYAASQMFENCVSLLDIEFPPNSLNAVTEATDISAIFFGCRAIRKLINFSPSASCSLADLSLSASALNRVYTDLPIVTDGQAITVTGNPGTSQAGHDPTIATAKGWTVTI